MNGLESLKDELSMITKTKNELEKRLQTTVIEKETIFASLEEALDRIHTLERHVREQDNKLKVSLPIARKSIDARETFDNEIVRLQSTTQHLDRVQQENYSLNEKLVSVDAVNVISFIRIKCELLVCFRAHIKIHRDIRRC